VTPPDDETPLPAALPHHDADPTKQTERVSSDDDELADLDPEDLLATRPHQKLDDNPDDVDPAASDILVDDFEDEDKTPLPRFLQQPGSERDQTLPRDRHLLDDDDEDTEA
jgi:hypothetical protein